MNGPKLRTDTSISIGMDDSRWDERCLYYLGLVVCSSWWIQHLAVLKILWCMLPRLVPRLKVWSVVV